MPRTPLIDVERLRVFLAVVHHGGFQAAADALFLSQPAVSAAIKALEEQLGRALFEPAGRRKRLTAAGERLAALAAPRLDGWSRIGPDLEAAISGEPSGWLRIGAGEAACQYLLLPLLGRFRKRFPAVQVRLLVHSRDETLRLLAGAGLDLGVRTLEALPAGLAFTPWVDTPRVLIAPRAAPLPRRPTVRDLAARPFVVPPRGSSSRALLEGALAREGLALTVATEAGGWEVLKSAVRHGLGIALVPELCLTPGDRRQLALAPARHLFPDDRYGVLARAGEAPSPAAAAFLELVRGEAGDRAGRD
jgi:DNA-binding transcriptional LysR family regulator